MSRHIDTDGTPGDERSIRRVGSAAGLSGAVALGVYFVAPFIAGWPFGGANPSDLAAYVASHETLFFAGAWLQVTGAVLSAVFFISVLRLALAEATVPGVTALVGLAALVSIVAVEAACLVAVPMAVAVDDQSSASTVFLLANGVFTRVYAAGPAPIVYIAIGLVLRDSPVLHGSAWRSALGLGLAFELAGLVAIVVPWGGVPIAILSTLQAGWIVVFALELGRQPARSAALARG
jgi:hypothetical protein